jgi:hypothetical protein
MGSAQVVLSFQITHLICIDRLVVAGIAIALAWLCERAFDLELFPLQLVALAKRMRICNSAPYGRPCLTGKDPSH